MWAEGDNGVDMGWTYGADVISMRDMNTYLPACPCVVSRSEVLGRFYNPNTTPKDKERVVVCLCSTGQELH